MRREAALLSLLAAFPSGCDRPPSTAVLAPMTIPAPAPDRSLLAADYVARGAPAPDRVWAPEDYSRVVEVLRQVAAEDVGRLPRVDSPSSGSLMARILDLRNLEILENETIPLEQRMGFCNGFMAATKALLMLYVGPDGQGLHVDREIVAILHFESKAVVLMMRLGLQKMAQLTEDELRSPVRQSGWEKMWNGVATMVSGRFSMLSERSHYGPAERASLARSLSELLEEFFGYLPELTRREILVRLEQTAREEVVADVMETLRACRRSLEGKAVPAIRSFPAPTSAGSESLPTTAAKPQVLKTGAGEPGPDGWCAAEASDGSFRVRLPHHYNEVVFESSDEKGLLRMRTLATRTPQGATYAAMLASRTGGEPPKADALEEMVETFRKKGDLRGSKDLVLGAWNGKELSLWSRQSESRTRFYVQGRRSFTLIVEVPFGQSPGWELDAGRFFDSFKPKD